MRTTTLATTTTAIGAVAGGVLLGCALLASKTTTTPMTTTTMMMAPTTTLGDAPRVHGISQACLDACRGQVPALVAAVSSTPMDCATIASTADASCLFTADPCVSEVDDNVALSVAIDESCPHAVADESNAATPRSAAALGSMDGSGNLGLPPAPSGTQGMVTFRLFAGCIDEAIKARHPEFHSKPIVDAYVVHHNYGSPRFFLEEDAIKMERIPAGSSGADGSCSGGTCAPRNMGFQLTTNQVDWEWGFALKNSDGKFLYEIGAIEDPWPRSPLHNSTCYNIQQYGRWWNRVITYEPSNTVTAVWGSCDLTCPVPAVVCDDGTWAQDGECVVQCATGSGPNAAGQCATCDDPNCDQCEGGTCTQCKNWKFLHNGQCLSECPANFESGAAQIGIKLKQEDFLEFAVSFDAKKRYTSPITEGTTPAIYFGHAYGSTATAPASTIFGDTTLGIGEAEHWTEAWVSAEADDICGRDYFSSGSYCTFSKPNGDGNGNCCTSYGKTMTFRLVYDGGEKDKAVVTGYGTRSTATSSTGFWYNGGDKVNVKTILKNAKKVKWTSRIMRDGSVSTWVGHSMSDSGMPTGPPTYTSSAGERLGAFKGFNLVKGAGWAEGGGIMRKIAASIKTSNDWERGNVCVASNA